MVGSIGRRGKVSVSVVASLIVVFVDDREKSSPKGSGVDMFVILLTTSTLLCTVFSVYLTYVIYVMYVQYLVILLGTVQLYI